MDPGTILYSRLSHAYVTTLISVITGQNIPLDALLQQCKCPLSPQRSHTLKSCLAGPSTSSSIFLYSPCAQAKTGNPVFMQHTCFSFPTRVSPLLELSLVFFCPHITMVPFNPPHNSFQLLNLF